MVEMEKLGVDTYVRERINVDCGDLKPALEAIRDKGYIRQPNNDYDISMFISHSFDCMYKYNKTPNVSKYNASIVHWETDALPEKLEKIIRRLHIIIAPSQFVADTIKAKMPDTEPKVAHPGHDPELYYYYNRENRKDKFRFLFVGDAQLRKGTDVLLKAYTQEFAPEENTELTIKTRDWYSEPLGYFRKEDFDVLKTRSDIKWIQGMMSDGEMAELYRSSDCFVSPHRSEGFGSCALEAMATGLPTVVTGWSGTQDFCGDDCTFKIDHELVEAPEGCHFGTGGGRWAEPSVDHLRQLMRQVFQDRNEALYRGKLASKRAGEFTWAKSAEKVKAILEAHLNG